MFNLHILLYDGLFLEPSAGQGMIPDEINEMGGKHYTQNWHCIEIHPINRQALKDKNYDIVGHDFDAWEPQPVYDDIFANPPFKRDRQHVEKMADCLKPGGSIVCVLPQNFETKKANQPVVDMLHHRFLNVEFYDTAHLVDKCAFKSTGTNIETSILYAASLQRPKREAQRLTRTTATRKRTR